MKKLKFKISFSVQIPEDYEFTNEDGEKHLAKHNPNILKSLLRVKTILAIGNTLQVESLPNLMPLELPLIEDITECHTSD